jgi:hypothetical protein
MTCFPTAVLAQAAIAGIVTDESGGAMQGVVVEASSPSLIERIRTAVSSAVLTYNNTFVPGVTWLQPLTILTPRFLKITAEVEF